MSTILLIVAAILFVDLAVARSDWSSQRRLAAAVAGASCAIVAFASIPNLLYLQKVVGRLLMPAGLLWAALFLAVAWSWHRRKLRSCAAIGAVFVSYTLIGSPAVGAGLLHTLEAEYRLMDAFEGPPLDAIFVMGGGTGRDPGGRPYLTSSGDRVALGARLHRAGRAPIVVTSGSTIEGIGVQRDIAAETADLMVAMGVPGDRIVRLTAPKNSSQEVAAYAELARQRGWRHVGLVTSAWHLRRAMQLADRAELPARPLPADFRGSLQWSGVLSVIPDGRGFNDVSTACWEYLGAAVGR